MATTVALPAPVIRVTRPALSASLIAASDLIAVTVSLTVAVIARYVLNGEFELALYWRLTPVLLLFPAVYALFGLYPGVASSTAREVQQFTVATTLNFVLIGTLLFLLKDAQDYSRLAFVGAWLLALVAVPLARAQLRNWFGKQPWWGYPIFVFGSGPNAQRVVKTLKEHPELGLHPVLVFDRHIGREHQFHGVPVSGALHEAPALAREMGVRRAIIAMPDSPYEDLIGLIESHANVFSRLYMVPNIVGLSSLGIETRDLGNTLTLEVRRSLLLPSCQAIKRLLDLSAGLAIFLMLLPVFAVIALLIRLESRGNALYRHRRLGHEGKEFFVWKFRTMHSDGDRILAEYLDAHPAERLEWEARRKLENDPRVTRLGRFLRRTSLDELPQLWNVLRGEMSLVGPRPIVRDEIRYYGKFYDLYTRVLPGLTGLWQVSGRSRTTYGERIELDAYYVRNWSPWLDIYLLARTVTVVLKGQGAY